MNTSNKIGIVFSTDHNYIMPTSVAISSLIRNSSSSKYNIYLLIREDVTPEDKIYLEQCVKGCDSSIKYLEMGNLYADAYEIRGISISCYYRLSIPDIIPEEDKVIYADVDTIFHHDLKPLFDIDLSDNYVGAVKGYIDDKYASEIGCDASQYFNSGVLLLNLQLMRKDQFTKKIKPYLSEKYKFQDQDILNITCSGRVKLLPLEYNVTHSIFEGYIKNDSKILKHFTQEETINITNPFITHFSGAKPWKGKVIRDGIWWEEYRKTPNSQSQYYLNGLYNSCYKIKNFKQLIKMLLISIKG